MNNNFFNMMQMMMRGGGNPQVFLQEQMQKNPQLMQKFNNLQTMMKGSKMSNKDFAIQYCKQNGIPEDQVMQVAKMFGLK